MPEQAIEHAAPGSCVLVLADGYPTTRTTMSDDVLKAAASQATSALHRISAVAARTDARRIARGDVEAPVVATDAFAAEKLARLRILAVQGCQFIPVEAAKSDLVLARVAGYDTAIYGLPRAAMPLLFRDAQGDWIATTKLSNFVTGRYAPSGEWLELWSHLLATLEPSGHAPRLAAEPSVRPAYPRDAALPKDVEAEAAAGYAHWAQHAGLLIAPSRQMRCLS